MRQSPQTPWKNYFDLQFLDDVSKRFIYLLSFNTRIDFLECQYYRIGELQIETAGINTGMTKRVRL